MTTSASEAEREFEAAEVTKTVIVRDAAAADAGPVWEWNNDPTARAMSGSTEPIPWEEHQAWFAARLADGASSIWVVEVNGEASGVVRFQRQALAGHAVVSIALAARARGRGVGTLALTLACARHAEELPGVPIEAWILDDNAASLRCFAAAGFVPVSRFRDLGGRMFVVHEWRPTAAASQGDRRVA